MTETELPNLFVYIVVGTILCSFAIGLMNRRSVSLRLSVLNRWGRWLSISLGLAYLVHDADWINKPFWVLVGVFFVGWLLLETVYTWFAISALSQSGLSLFPRFSENTSGEEWPAQKALIEIKDWLRSKGFRRAQALIAEVGTGIHVRASVFQSEDDTIRFQILFLPQSNGLIGYCFSFASRTAEGERYVTDNLFMPYGGFYPENWNVLRKPWNRSPQRLLKRHKKRTAKLSLQKYDDDVVSDLNDEQRILEKTNLEEGFLVPHEYQDEFGRITWEGRYRVWKEVWLLNYFGIPSK